MGASASFNTLSAPVVHMHISAGVVTHGYTEEYGVTVDLHGDQEIIGSFGELGREKEITEGTSK